MSKTTDRLIKAWPRFLHEVVGAPYQPVEELLRQLRSNPSQLLQRNKRLALAVSEESAHEIMRKYGPYGIFNVPDADLPKITAVIGADYGVMTDVVDHTIIMGMLLEQLANPKSFLDVGCGICPYTSFLLKYEYLRGKVVGVDHSPEMLERAGTIMILSGVTHPLVLGQASKLPFGGEAFEQVFCNDALEWMKGWRQAVAEMCRVLKPGGHLFLCYSTTFRRTYIPPGGIEEILDLERVAYTVHDHDAKGSQTPRRIIRGRKG